MKEKMMSTAATGIAVLAIAVTGCSSTDPSGAEIPENATETLQTYFEAFGTNDSNDMSPMLEVSAEDSPAHLYAQHQMKVQIASEAAGEAEDPDIVTVDDDSVTMRYAGLSDAEFEELSEEEQAEVVTVFSEFEYGEDGKLKTWSSEPGGPLAERIDTQNGKATSGKTTIKSVSSYVTNADALIVTLDIANKSGNDVDVIPTGYTTAEKRQVKVQATPYNAQLTPGTRSDMYVSIENGKPGGKLQFDIYNTDDFGQTTSANIRVQ